METILFKTHLGPIFYDGKYVPVPSVFTHKDTVDMWNEVNQAPIPTNWTIHPTPDVDTQLAWFSTGCVHVYHRAGCGTHGYGYHCILCDCYCQPWVKE